MLQIDNLTFSSPFILAPLAGYSDLSFRLLCKEMGAGYTVSEMISCHGLCYRQKNTIRMLHSVEEERPVAFQLFGAEPDTMKEAAKILMEFSPDMVDINMGCPVKKVTRKGAGAALMTTPLTAAAVIKGVVEASEVPVTVKMRLGKESASINVVEFAKMAEECGAAAVTVHARTWAQAFSGTPQIEYISEVKNALSIPVIGNGDIESYAGGLKMMEETGCDGVMIGRGALGNPWVFSEQGRPETIEAISRVAFKHLSLLENFLPPGSILGYVKNQISRYYKGVHGSAMLRKEIFAAPSLDALKEILTRTKYPLSFS